MVRGRFGRIKRRVASTLAAVFTLVLPWALGGVPVAHAIEDVKADAKAAPTEAPHKAPASAEKPASEKKTARVHKAHKRPKKRLATKGAASDKRHEVAAPKVDHEEPNVAAKHETAKGHDKHEKAKPHAKPEATTKPAKHEKTHAKIEQAGATVAASVKTDKPEPSAQKSTSKKTEAGRRGKKAKSSLPGGKRRTSKKDADAEKPPCFAKAISIDRNGLEGEVFSLVDCKGTVLEDAREKLSVLARPWGSPRPTLPSRKKAERAELRVEKGKPKAKGKTDKPADKAEVLPGSELGAAEIAPNVRLLDAGLLARIETISKHFSDKGVSLVSGYRPKSKGSLHQSARALDFRIAGVSNEELVSFCKTLEDTGCGYYPNSSFVHVDVRTKGTGSVSWIDASGPGETPRYVTQWPPPPDEKGDDKADDKGDDKATAIIDDEPPAAPAAVGTKNSPAAQEAPKVADVAKEAAKEIAKEAPKPVVTKEADPKDKGDAGACVPVKAEKSANSSPASK